MRISPRGYRCVESVKPGGDGRLGRNFLRGAAGDAINALLCGAGHNLRKILRQKALLCSEIRQRILRLLQQQNANTHRLLMSVA